MTLLASPVVQRRFLAEAEPDTWVDLPGSDGAAAPGLRPQLSASLRVTADGVRHLAPMTYETARDWAYWHACRLPTRLEATAMARLPHIPVQSMHYRDPDFATLDGAKLYTKRVDYQIRIVREQIAEAGDAAMAHIGSPVDNESKVWICGEAPGGVSPGWALLVGFFDDAGKPANLGTGAPGKRGYGPRGEPHNSQHVDYSMAPRFVMQPHETKRTELVTLALTLAGPKGSRSPTGREVADYFRLGVRDVDGVLTRTGYAAGWDWCAAGACWLGAEVGLGLGVHSWRITVWELITDARASQRWYDAEDDPAEPQVGDLLCFRRKGGDPRTPGQTGHVETYLGDGRTLSGNSPGWLIKSGRLTSPDYVGYVAR